MPTHAALAAGLLYDCAAFFRGNVIQNPSVALTMNNMADLYERAAKLIKDDPAGETQDQKHARLAEKLLNEAAAFFENLGAKNELISEQMSYSADVMRYLATQVGENPLGVMD